MIATERLLAELRAAGLPVEGCGVAPVADPGPPPRTTQHQRGEGWVRVLWAQAPTPAQRDQAAAAVAAHDGSPTADEKCNAVPFPGRLLAAHNEVLWALATGNPVPQWARAAVVQAHQQISAARG